MAMQLAPGMSAHPLSPRMMTFNRVRLLDAMSTTTPKTGYCLSCQKLLTGLTLLICCYVNCASR